MTTVRITLRCIHNGRISYRERQPKTLIFWRQNDIFFTQEGGKAYLKELPNIEMHRLDSGHFAVEDCLDEITNNINRFYLEKVVKIPA